jgi:hypothetical protein
MPYTLVVAIRRDNSRGSRIKAFALVYGVDRTGIFGAPLALKSRPLGVWQPVHHLPYVVPTGYSD